MEREAGMALQPALYGVRFCGCDYVIQDDMDVEFWSGTWRSMRLRKRLELLWARWRRVMVVMTLPLAVSSAAYRGWWFHTGGSRGCAAGVFRA